MTAVHDVEHPVFDGPILPVDEHDLAELLAGLVVLPREVRDAAGGRLTSQ